MSQLVPCLQICVENDGLQVQTERTGCQVSPHGTVGQQYAPFAATRPPANPGDQAEGDPAATGDSSSPIQDAVIADDGAKMAIAASLEDRDGLVRSDEQNPETVVGTVVGELNTARSGEIGAREVFLLFWGLRHWSAFVELRQVGSLLVDLSLMAVSWWPPGCLVEFGYTMQCEGTSILSELAVMIMEC
jgi:hypothetical protein